MVLTVLICYPYSPQISRWVDVEFKKRYDPSENRNVLGTPPWMRKKFKDLDVWYKNHLPANNEIQRWRIFVKLHI